MPRRVPEYRQELVDWVRGLYGSGRRFTSARKLSRAAGWNPNQVNNIETDGYGSAETLIDVARAAGVVPWDGLIAGGFLTEEEVKGIPVQELTQEEQDLLRMFREASASIRGVTQAGLRGGLEYQRQQDGNSS